MEETEILSRLEEISKQVAIIVKKITTIVKTESKTDQIAAALAAAQNEYKPLYYNKENRYFMTPYSNLHAILAATRSALNKNGLAFVQVLVSNEDNSLILNSRLLHTSGQELTSTMRIVAKNEYQALESAINHYRCNAAQSLLGIAAEDDALDDNGERAAANSREIFAKGTALNQKYNPKETGGPTITKEQLEELEYVLGEHVDVAGQLMDALKIQSLSDMPKDKYLMAIKRSHEIINAREGIK